MQAIDIRDLPVQSGLMKRFDRKFLCSVSQLDALLDQLDATHCYVNVGGERYHIYENEYWDLPSKVFYHDHRRGIPRRLKFRRRTYRTNGLSFWELKVKHPRGYQDKRRIPVEGQEVDGVVDSMQANRVFGHLLGDNRLKHQIKGGLEPSMKITYQRMTLWGSQTKTRLTVDTQLQAWMDGLRIEFPGWSLVELKQARRERHALDTLAAQGVLKPCSFSKYHRTMQIWEGLSDRYRDGSSEMNRYGTWVGQHYEIKQDKIY
ncbi:MAG: VTC domain-containing protein [Sphingomonadales bacterium]|nr:VTC domain-containing protein [Sphingomonadales bacterium]